MAIRLVTLGRFGVYEDGEELRAFLGQPVRSPHTPRVSHTSSNAVRTRTELPQGSPSTNTTLPADITTR